MNPLDLILWALAVLITVFAAYMVFSIIRSAIRAVRRPSDRDERPVYRGERKP